MGRELPVPESPAESLLLRQSVLLFVRHGSAAADRRFHEVFRTRSCDAQPPIESEQVWMDPRQDVARLLAGWAGGYDAWFRARHTIPAALRARLWLEANPTSRASVPDLARTVGASRASLEARFQAIYGLPVAENARILRLIEGLRRLRAGCRPVDEIAAAVGYRSVNKFYARLSEYCGLKPSEVRTMDAAAYESLLATLTAGRRPRGSEDHT
jgi:AraC-like DNA-binding protein